MPKSEYYWRWIKTAFRDFPAPLDLWSGIAGTILNVLAHFIPAVERAMSDLTWQLSLWIAGAVVLVRLVLAPYWIAKEDAEKIHRQQREIDELQDRLKPRLVILGVVYETEPSQAISFPNIPCIREAKIKVRNIGAEILRECLVKLENLKSDAWHQHKWDTSVLKTQTQDIEGLAGGKFTIRAGEERLIEVASLDETTAEEITVQFESRLIPRTIPRSDKYYFDIVAYSESPPDRKKFKLYVDDGRLTMEEST